MLVEIPWRKALNLKHLVFDYNGTLATDGKMLPSAGELLTQLSERFAIHVITADTFGTVAEECASLPVGVYCLKSSDHTYEKEQFIRSLPESRAVAIGNGANDLRMLEEAALAVAVIGQEGCALETLLKADIVVHSIEDGLRLFLNPQRLIATLRR